MFVKTTKEFLHYPVGKVLEITTELYKEQFDKFEIININKIEEDGNNKRPQPTVEGRRGGNRKGN
jgi:hypothetical protein